MSQKIVFSEYGAPEVLTLKEVPIPVPDAGQVVVRNHAVGLNFIETYVRSGLYPVPSLPSGLGTEGAGVVEALGEGVQGFNIGDRVAYATGPQGAYATHHVLAPEHLVKIPDAISFEQAAAMLLKGLTVQYLFCQTHVLKAGEMVLFHAAAGGVGSFACQWAKAIGAKLIGVVSSPQKKAKALSLGAWACIDTSCEDVVSRVKELTGGQKCSVVYDSVGKNTWPISLDCVATRGLLVSFGNASGPVTDVNLGVLAQKGSLYVTRPTLATYAADPHNLQKMADELFAMVASGAVNVEIGQRYGLADVVTAHRELAGRQTMGASVLLP